MLLKTKEEAKKILEEAGIALSDEELDEVSGGDRRRLSIYWDPVTETFVKW